LGDSEEKTKLVELRPGLRGVLGDMVEKGGGEKKGGRHHWAGNFGGEKILSWSSEMKYGFASSAESCLKLPARVRGDLGCSQGDAQGEKVLEKKCGVGKKGTLVSTQIYKGRKKLWNFSKGEGGQGKAKDGRSSF